jgi:D-sedoheptulose 7-phosphate isomerase
MATTTSMPQHVKDYSEKLLRALDMDAMAAVPILGEALRESWKLGRSVYLCGNGGSAGNAIHLANDFLYCAGISNGIGLRVEDEDILPSK